ncbi:MAG: hypothetical protein Q9217_002760 [Psora testacea]
MARIHEQIAEDGHCQIRELNELVVLRSSKIEDLEATVSTAEVANSQLQHDNDELQAQLDEERRKRKQQAEQAAEEIARKTTVATDFQAMLEKQAAISDEQSKELAATKARLDRITANEQTLATDTQAKLEQQAAELKQRNVELEVKDLKMHEMQEAADESEKALNELQGNYDKMFEQIQILKYYRRGKVKKKPGREEIEYALVAGDTWEPSLVLPPSEALSNLSFPTFEEISSQPAPEEPGHGTQSSDVMDHAYDDESDRVRVMLPGPDTDLRAPLPRPWKKTRRGTRGSSKKKHVVVDYGEEALLSDVEVS